MADIVLYSMADFFRFKQIIEAYAKTGSKFGLKALKETELFLKDTLGLSDRSNEGSKYIFIPSSGRSLMTYLDSVCDLIKEIKEIFHIKGLSSKALLENKPRKKRRRKKKIKKMKKARPC